MSTELNEDSMINHPRK